MVFVVFIIYIKYFEDELLRESTESATVVEVQEPSVVPVAQPHHVRPRRSWVRIIVQRLLFALETNVVETTDHLLADFAENDSEIIDPVHAEPHRRKPKTWKQKQPFVIGDYSNNSVSVRSG